MDETWTTGKRLSKRNKRKIISMIISWKHLASRIQVIIIIRVLPSMYVHCVMQLATEGKQV